MSSKSHPPKTPRPKSMRNPAARRGQRYRQVLAALSDGLAILDREGLIKFFQPAQERILGLEPGALEGRHWTDVVCPEDLPAAHSGFARAVAQPGIPVTARVRLRHRDGGARNLEVTAVNLLHERWVAGVLVHGRDVTHTVSLEAQLQHARQLQTLGEVAAGLAHDFNNLIHLAAGYTDQAREHVPPGTAPSEDLARAQAALDRAGALSRQLLSMGRSGPGERAVIDVSRWASQALTLAEHAMGRRIAVAFRAGARVPPVRADAALLDQVLLNLCLNARDAMPQGGTLTVITEPVPAPPGAPAGGGPWACIAVRDSGSGMPPEVLARLFEPFFTTKAPGRGTGLGLATARGNVEQHGGVLQVESALGQGSTFRICLPPAGTEVPDAPQVSAPPVELPGSGATVLVADDDPDARALVEQMLLRTGYRVLSAGSGEEALRLFVESRRPVDLAILDVMMPGAAGPEIAQRLRVFDPALPVLLCTGYARQMLEPDLKGLAGVEVISKPYAPLILLQRVHALLGIRAGLFNS